MSMEMEIFENQVMSRRCDKPMKRSKEQCFTPFRRPWMCNGECMYCICCIEKLRSGEERHVRCRKSK